ncbi:MAG: response regulator [Roseburia sp.]|nr:response regulator [Roseburia sp.]
MLIVDDNLLNLEVANEMIKSEGFQTVTAESGAEALGILAESSEGEIDILLTDISMPEMDGYELTAAVRAHQREDVRNLYVIALSAYGYEECRGKLKECGADAFLNKPFDVSEFVRLAVGKEGAPQV